MKDRDLLVSLYLDGRLEGPDADAFEARLETDAELRARLERLRTLQAASEALGHARAGFTADEVLARPAPPARRWRGLGFAAAAVLLLAVSHGVAFWMGQSRAVREMDALAETEAVLERAMHLDAAAPHDELRTELIGLRNDIRPLPGRLAAAAPPRGPGERLRRDRLARALERIEVAFEQFEDPGFLGIAIAGIARTSLDDREAAMRFVPANLTSYSNLVPVGDGRFRMIVVTSRDGVPRTLADTGTLAELKDRNPGIEFIEERE